MAVFDFTHHRIMIADTCQDTVAKARTAYALQGLTNFTSFESGSEALNAIDVFDPDVVIVGIELKDIDGIELLGKIRSHNGGKFAKLPTLLMFDKDHQNRLKEASKLGVGGALRKPLQSGKLLRMTQVAIEKSQLSTSPRVDTFKLVEGSGPIVSDAPKQPKKKEKNLSLDGAMKIAQTAGAELKKDKPKPPANPLAKSKIKPKAKAQVKVAPAVVEKKTAPPKLVPKPEIKKTAEAVRAKPKEAPQKAKVEVEAPIDLGEVLDAHRHWVDTAHKEGKRAALKAVDLRDQELTKADLTGIQIVGGLFKGMDLSEITLRKSNLSGSNFTGATMIRANLAVCRLKMVKLKKTNLSLSDMRGADLSKADLTEANLSNCDLGGAHLEGTNLKGANLSTAKGLIVSQIKRAIYDNSTKMPAYLLKQNKKSA